VTDRVTEIILNWYGGSMAYEHKPGTFSLFKNDKGDNDKRPDYRGEGKDLSGGAIEVSAWLKEGSKGKFMSCTFKPKGQQQAKTAAPTREPGEDDDDTPPF
jgi:hypothetical protein